ncbi:polysaccharide deacetylase family protein [uncultured Bacteroides sp.]|uniref:polysaccharide deacetylase family protein n=1 Tax=uncultured Bacteroides sp. TaxID=162156 RepID=UPI002AAACEC6|nr:polysaccharide deacetylase family protein [uncultured Bacteroides sp.]
MIALIIILFFGTFMFYASYSIKSNVYVKAFCKKETSEKVVAITFDDGPDAVQTLKILDVLKEYKIQACFFCIGSRVENNEKLIQRMVREGHLIGNHSYSHTNCFPLYGKQKMSYDLRLCQQKLEEASQEKITLFRPPFGVTNPTIGRLVKKMGFTVIGWSIRSLDTQQSSPEKVLRRVRRQLHPGAVILLHDVLPQSEVLLKMILELLADKGYTIKRIDLM